jgi:hypothetical protein
MIPHHTAHLSAPKEGVSLYNTRIRLTLPPTQDGAKQLRERDGKQLVGVRHRYDKPTKRRWKTVELIIEKSMWETPNPTSSLTAGHLAGCGTGARGAAASEERGRASGISKERSENRPTGKSWP